MNWQVFKWKFSVYIYIYYIILLLYFLQKSLNFRDHLFTPLVIFCVSVKTLKEAYPGAEQMFLLSYFCLLVSIKISQKPEVCCIFINIMSIQG